MDLYGIIGWPVKHSLSPAMHNAAFKKLGIDAEYRLFPVKPDQLEYFLLNKKEVVGFNVTIPHKVRAKEILEKRKDGLEPDSDYVALSGAINTVKRENAKLRYTNTDVVGFLSALDEDLGFDCCDKEILLLGCGGAGRAVIAALLSGEKRCKKIYIYDKDEKATHSTKKHFLGFSILKDRLEFVSDEKIPNVIKSAQLLVNATPIGMKEGDDRSVIDKDLLHNRLSVYDLVYNRETKLVRDARSLGLSASGGLGMFLYQGVHSFQFWTGQQAPIDVMRTAIS